MIISPVHFPSYQFWPRKKRGDSFFDSVFYFRRGSWAFAYGLMALAKKRGKEKIRVWFPDYFCREPLDVLKHFPIEIAFYPITKKLTPDWDVLERMIDTKAPDALVLVHYFGFPNDLIGAKNFCQKHNIDLVEDCAHVMHPFDGVGTSGTFSIWSPWKFFPLPELGILWVRDDIRPFVEGVSSSHQVFPLVRWWVKREVQRLLCTVGVNWYKRSHNSSSPDLAYARSPSPSGRGEGEGASYASPNTLSLKLFERYIRSTDTIHVRRVKNYRALELFFKERYPAMVIFGTLPYGTVPYAFPYITSKSAAALSKEFIARGIPAFPWPDLPEEVKKNPSSYPWAHFYADHLLLLPVHQNISEQAMGYMQQSLTTLIV